MMQLQRRNKAGYTLVEVLIVVSIMGILSSMGVVSFRQAIANARVKDAALNTAAFLERIANDANRMSKTLCMKATQNTLNVYEGECSSSSSATPVLHDSYELESPATFNCVSEYKGDILTNEEGSLADDWTRSSGVEFKPRIGLSTMPSKGFICIQYGTSRNFAGVKKTANKNQLVPIWHVGVGWQDL
jgi:prepilin-type N-terminal cleavage/methylation domain-containing protein